MFTEKRTLGMPGVEFEGPMGMFWPTDEVPFEAMVQGIAEILYELRRRGYKQEVILEAIRRAEYSKENIYEKTN